MKRAHRLPHYKRGRERKRRLIWLPRRHSLPSARNNTFLFPWLSSDLFCLGGKKGREGEGGREREGERGKGRGGSPTTMLDSVWPRLTHFHPSASSGSRGSGKMKEISSEVVKGHNLATQSQQFYF